MMEVIRAKQVRILSKVHTCLNKTISKVVSGGGHF